LSVKELRSFPIECILIVLQRFGGLGVAVVSLVFIFGLTRLSEPFDLFHPLFNNHTFAALISAFKPDNSLFLSFCRGGGASPHMEDPSVPPNCEVK
jgi:hypothetical protein